MTHCPKEPKRNGRIPGESLISLSRKGRCAGKVLTLTALAEGWTLSAKTAATWGYTTLPYFRKHSTPIFRELQAQLREGPPAEVRSYMSR